MGWESVRRRTGEVGTHAPPGGVGDERQGGGGMGRLDREGMKGQVECCGGKGWEGRGGRVMG